MNPLSLQQLVRTIVPPWFSLNNRATSLNNIQNSDAADARVTPQAQSMKSAASGCLNQISILSENSSGPKVADYSTFDFALNSDSALKPEGCDHNEKASFRQSLAALSILNKEFESLAATYGHPIDWNRNTNFRVIGEGKALIRRFEAALQGLNPQKDKQIATNALFAVGSIMTGLRSGDHMIHLPYSFTRSLPVNQHFSARSCMQFALKNMLNDLEIYTGKHRAMCYDALIKIVPEDDHIVINGWKCTGRSLENALAKANADLADPYSISPDQLQSQSTIARIKSMISRPRRNTI